MVLEWLKKYEGKKILILGFGMEGQSTYKLFKEKLETCTLQIMDNKPQNVKAYFAVGEVQPFIYSEEAYLKPESDVDLVFKSPGIPLKDLEGHIDPAIVTSQSDAFIHAYREQIIGITGTKGKSTTATFLYELLKAQGVATALIGNIGKPPFDVVDEVETEGFLVYELSSHQLETVRTSPKYGVVLNLFEEHLDHYHSYDHYAEAKMNIGRYQLEGDAFIYGNYTDEICRRADGFKGVAFKIGQTIDGLGIVDEGQSVTINYGTPLTLDDGIKRRLLGHHNLVNMATAILIARLIGADDTPVSLATLAEFKGLAHRLAYVARVNGVTYYNDSISTIPQATIAAVESIPKVGTVLIGGMDRGIDYNILIQYIKKRVDIKWLMMPDTGHRIGQALKTLDHVVFVNNMAEAVVMGSQITPEGKACLLSPAAPSYGFYKNFIERGEAFEAMVAKIQVKK